MEIAVIAKVCHLIKTKRGKTPISKKESRILTKPEQQFSPKVKENPHQNQTKKPLLFNEDPGFWQSGVI